MNESSSSKNIHIKLTVVKALNLPKYHLRTPRCYVSVSIDSGQPQTTKTIKGANPEWNETFIFDAQESSTVLIQIFHARSPQPKIKAEVTFSVAPCFQPGVQSIEPTHYDLLLPGSSSKLQGCTVVISCVASPGGSNETATLGGDVVVVRPERNQALLESFVHTAAESSNIPSLPGIYTAGTTIDTVSTVTSSDSFSIVMGLLKRFVQIGDAIAEVHPYAKLAWNLLTAVQKTLQSQQDRDDRVRRLWATVLDALDFMNQAEPLKEIKGLEKTVQALMKQIYDCTLFLRSYGDKCFAKRTLENTFTSTTDDSIQQFTKAFTDLKLRFRDRLDLDSWKIASTMKDGVVHLVATTDCLARITEDERLESLPGAKLGSVQWDPDRACLPGTREQLLGDIVQWAHDLDSERILWLTGAAGTGKSSIANSVAQRLHSVHRLGASFRFDRDKVTPDTPSQLFGNLCYQLAHYDDQVRVAVLSAIQSGCGGAMSLRMQAKTLLVEPLKRTEIIGPVVIVIDALDESGIDDRKVKASRETLVHAIVEELPSLPPSIKVLITSRDEGSISLLMPEWSSCLRKDMAADDEDTRRDILKYIQHRMRRINKLRCDPLDGWPEDAKESELASRADGLFVWADVACTSIENGCDPEVQLDELLNPSGESVVTETQLDRLFIDVIRRSLTNHQGIRANNGWHYVVGSITALKTPLTSHDMDSLLGLSRGHTDVFLIAGRQIQLTTTRNIISSLRPLLRIDPDIEDVVRLLHKSVFDFLTGRADASIRVDLGVQNGILAIRCLDQINRNLRYDICEIGDKSLLNSEVDGLLDRIRERIPVALRYACCYFADHLHDASTPYQELTDELHKFITRNLLYWIEVMSLLNKLREAELCLHIVSDYLKRDTAVGPDTLEIIQNAISLLRTCGYGIALSTLHIYSSAIPFTPKTTELYKTYHHIIANLPTITSSHPLWTTSLRTLEGHSEGISSVVFSPDGTKLASASWDNTVRLWDVETGIATVSALKGYSKSVYSAVFSPDGRKLASTSEDNIVQLWDVETGSAIGSALKGHSESVRSAVFSPDGRKLASASWDSTVQLWDVETGIAIGPALEGHGRCVTSVVFSPDGRRLASASEDKTVRLWDAETGMAIWSALEGHGQGVVFVVFSPDGRTLASASDDNTVRLWDVETGTSIGSALKGHSRGVNSVVFSPDGGKLASASWDNTVRLWDIKTGIAIGSALVGHSQGVTSVVFSPDGTKLASASWDNTVRLWNVETRMAIGSALEGHSRNVTSVVFSPDGRILASASWDSTVRLWDVETGIAIGSAVEGHSRHVNSVVFSPDGRRLASASEDKTVRLWNVESGTVIGSALEGHSNSVTLVIFSPDGRKLASTSTDNTVRLWDVETGTAIGSALDGHGQHATSVMFSPDGTELISTLWDNAVQSWDVETGAPIETRKGSNTNSVLRSNSDKNPVPSHIHSPITLEIDESGFLRYHSGERLLWLPAHLRGNAIVAPDGTIVIGGRIGAMTFIKISG